MYLFKARKELQMTFKLASLSDLHLGYKSSRRVNRQGINLREADGYLAFAQVVDEIIAAEVDAVVVAGDIFHNPTPDIRTIVFAQNQFRRFHGAGVPVYMLAGNHDTNDVAADVAASRVLHDPGRRIFSFIEPYKMVHLTPDMALHMVSHHMYSTQHDTMMQVKTSPGVLNIFSTHGSVIDPLLQAKLHTEQSPREIVIPDFLLQDHQWDSILLGHIHERGWVGSKDGTTDTLGKKLYYNGSLLRRGFSDKECALGRGWTLWEITPEGTFTPTIHEVAQRPQVDFPIINGKKKSTKEISGIIVDNLSKALEDTAEFSPASAPILRQRIIHLEPSRVSALDWAAIHRLSSQAFTWDLKPLNSVETASLAKATGESTSGWETTDVVKMYDDWLPTSSTFTKTDKTLRDQVKESARRFVELGQEVMLNE